MNFIKNKMYKITTPSQSFDGVEFKSVTSELKFLDKDENWSRLTSIQKDMAYSELYTVWEDTVGCIAVLKIKDDYIVEVV